MNLQNSVSAKSSGVEKKQNKKNTSTVSKLGVLAVVLSSLYYGWNLTKDLVKTMMKEDARKEVAGNTATKEFDFFLPIGDILARQPWASGVWQEIHDENIRFWVDVKVSPAVVRIEGLPTGSIELHLNCVSRDGNSYSGIAMCREHGGRLAENPKFHLLNDNQIRIDIRAEGHATQGNELCFRRLNDENAAQLARSNN